MGTNACTMAIQFLKGIVYLIFIIINFLFRILFFEILRLLLATFLFLIKFSEQNAKGPIVDMFCGRGTVLVIANILG